MLSALPPSIRPRLIDGASNSSEDSRVNGSDWMARKASTPFRTALDQAIAFDARPELLLASGNHVEVPMEDDARNLVGWRADGRDQHRQRVVLVMLHLDAAGFEPPLHESCGRNQLLRARSVVGD